MAHPQWEGPSVNSLENVPALTYPLDNRIEGIPPIEISFSRVCLGLFKVGKTKCDMLNTKRSETIHTKGEYGLHCYTSGNDSL